MLETCLSTCPPYCFQDGKHPGIEMMYEYHLTSNKDDSHHGLMRGMGQWRLTQLFHDVPFLPQLVVSMYWLLK